MKPNESNKTYYGNSSLDRGYQQVSARELGYHLVLLERLIKQQLCEISKTLLGEEESSHESATLLEVGVHVVPFRLSFPGSDEQEHHMNDPPPYNVHSGLLPSMTFRSHDFKATVTYSIVATVKRAGFLKPDSRKAKLIPFRISEIQSSLSLASPREPTTIYSRGVAQFLCASARLRVQSHTVLLLHPEQPLPHNISLQVAFDSNQSQTGQETYILQSFQCRLRSTVEAHGVHSSRSYTSYDDICTITGRIALPTACSGEWTELNIGSLQSHLVPTTGPSFCSPKLVRKHGLEFMIRIGSVNPSETRVSSANSPRRRCLSGHLCILSHLQC